MVKSLGSRLWLETAGLVSFHVWIFVAEEKFQSNPLVRYNPLERWYLRSGLISDLMSISEQ